MLSSLEALARYLISEARLIEHSSDARSQGSTKPADAARRRDAKEAVPTDRVKDAPALARELRWRVRVAVHGSSDVEDEGDGFARAGVKRKRKGVGGGAAAAGTGGVGSPTENGHGNQYEPSPEPRFRNFEPKKWDAYNVETSVGERVRRRVPENRQPPPLPPASSSPAAASNIPQANVDWTQPWLDFSDALERKESGDGGDKQEEEEIEVDIETVQPEVVTKREVMTRVRRTERGLERQRVERIIEIWEWEGSGLGSGPEVKAE